MPTPPPDPTGRPSSAKRAPGPASSEFPKPEGQPGESAEPSANAGPASTSSHHPAPQPSELADLLRGSSSGRRSPTNSDIVQMLANPGASPIVSPGAELLGNAQNIDDAPTVITRNHGNGNVLPPPPLPLPVSGDPPAIAGRRLGHFELIEAIGAGGMAAVLKARDLELGRIVALKILPPEAARDPESITRFKQEARAAAMLDHENIARAYFCGEDQGLHFIAFEFVEGENLRQLIDRRGPIPAGECIRYMIQVAAGLSHAAERGVVHRDIKPSNILITPDGRAKIVDMGLARQLAGPDNGGVTQSGVTLGTFDYISPEQALDPRRADVRSDIYSLGCAFYHALTGRPPVPEGTAAKKLHAHQHLDPLDPRQINPTIPDELAAILAGMMAKNPDQRYQTPADLISHLKGAAERLKLSLDVVASDSTVQAVPASQALLTEPPRLRLGWVVGAAAVAIAVAAFALSPGDFGRRQNPPPWAANPASKSPDQFPGPNPGPQPHSGQPADGVVLVHTAEALAEALANPKTTRVHLGPGPFDLTTLTEGIAFAGKELELIGSPDGTSKLIVQASHSIPPNGKPSPGSLTIARAESLTVRGVWLEVHAPPFPGDLLGAEGIPTHPAGLTVQSATHVNLIDSTFVSLASPDDEAVAVAVSSAPDAPLVKVLIDRCVFGHGKDVARGGIAILVPARAEVTVDDSGFGPHSAAIQFLAPKDDGTETPPLAPAKVKLFRSSFMLDPKCAVVATMVPVSVTAGYCVFAPVGIVATTPPADPFGTVLQVTGKVDGATFNGVSGQKNAYYGVNPVADKDAVALSLRPWSEQKPLDALTGAEPWRAFALDTTEPRLSLADREIAIVGAQFYVPSTRTRRAYPTLFAWPPTNLPKGSPTEPRQIVWYPYPKDGEILPPGTSSDLVALLRTARTGDIILIRHTGALPIDKTVELEKPRGGLTDFKVTFRPFPGSKPILTADPLGRALDQTLFRLLGGEVAFEDVQFILKPSRPKNPQIVAAVAVVGGKGCTFTNCVFTLAEEDDAKAAAVLVADPDRVMAMDGAIRPTPDVKFEKCLIRGKGRGVWVPVSRAVKVDASNSLTAIDGPLFLAEPAGKATVGARSSLKLNRVTALVGGPMVELRGGKVGEMRTSGLVPVDVEANESLFAAVPGAGQPLVEFDGIEAADAKNVLSWQVQKANRYANFDTATAVMIVRPGGDGSTPKEWDWNQWIAFAGEPPTAGKPVGKVIFEKPPAGLKELATIKPADANVKDVEFPDLTDPKPTDAGVDAKAPRVPWEPE